MQKSSSLILPGDPDFNQPLVMGDPYANALTPKLAAQRRIEESEKRIITGMSKLAMSQPAWAPEHWMTKMAQASYTAGGVSNMLVSPMWFSPLHTVQNWQTPAKRREVYMWCRFFYMSDPKVAAAIDFYSRFSMNNFELVCKNQKLKRWYDHFVCKKLGLNEKFKEIASEYFMLGDVFIHTDIACPTCGGTALDPQTGEMCNHKDGNISKLIILNPDWIEVQQNQISDEPNIVMVPDEELKRIIFMRQPKVIYDRIPESIKALVQANQPIPMSNRTISHLKNMPVPYGTYGTSLIRRLFMTLAYKQKLMTANWIVAERLILPIRVVKVGNDERPASATDIADMQQQLAATQNDPHFTLITHHAFDLEFYGASGKILQVTQEMELIGKEILDGFMLNQALLNGEMASYSGAAVGVETLIRRIESMRDTLADWAHKHIFEPIARMRGYIDEEESEDLGDTVFMYPTIKWNDLNLKDKTQWYQILLQLHDKQLLSSQTLMDELDLDYDQEVKRLRYEQAAMLPGSGGGNMPGAGGAGGGLGGMMGGGAAGGAGDMGAGGADLGGAPGADAGAMGGAMGAGGDMGAGAAPGGAPTAASGKIMKKGKTKEKETEPVPAKMVKLTRCEQELAGILDGIATARSINKNAIRFQFPVQNPKGGKHYAIDWAIPQIKLGIEADGEAFHSSPDQKESDQERDFYLARRGWTILRFSDRVLSDAPHAVQETINTYITKLSSKHTKTASSEEPVHCFVSTNGKLIDLKGNYDKYVERHTKPS